MTALAVQAAAALACVLALAAARRPPTAPLWTGPVLKYRAAIDGHTVHTAAEPVVHVGADMHWHPALEVATPPPVAVVAGDHRPDLFEQLLLADFDALIDSWRVDPPWLTEWRDTVDAAYAAAGLDTEVHHRWRYSVLDMPTGEFRIVPAPREEGLADA